MFADAADFVPVSDVVKLAFITGAVALLTPVVGVFTAYWLARLQKRAAVMELDRKNEAAATAKELLSAAALVAERVDRQAKESAERDAAKAEKIVEVAREVALVAVKAREVAHKVEVVAEKTAEVKVVLEATGDKVEKKLFEVHTLVNSAHGASLRLTAELSRWKAGEMRRTGDPKAAEAEAAADVAERLHCDHESKQKLVDDAG